MAERGCYNCGQYGHIKRDCPELRCYYCNERGHFSRSCPRRYPSRKVPTGSPSPGGDVKGKPSPSRDAGRVNLFFQQYPSFDTRTWLGHRSLSRSLSNSSNSTPSSPVLPVEEKDMESNIRSIETVKRVAETIFKLKKDSEGPFCILPDKPLTHFQEEKNSGLLCIPPKEKDLQRGDLDIIIIHRVHGYVHIEVKAFGDIQDQFDEKEKQERLKVVLRRAIKRLEKGRKVLQILQPRGHSINISNSLALPNISREYLRLVLQDDPDLRQELGNSMSSNAAKIDVEDLCLCSDDLPPKDGIVDEADENVRRAIDRWWSNVTQTDSPQAMSPETYRYVLASFCNNEDVKSFSEAVHDTGKKYQTLRLDEQQRDVIQSDRQYVFISGPPGCGKTVVLAEKALQWLHEKKTVFLVYTHERTTNQPGNEFLWHFIETISKSDHKHSEKVFDRLHKKQISDRFNVDEFLDDVVAIKNDFHLGKIPKSSKRKSEDIMFEEVENVFSAHARNGENQIAEMGEEICFVMDEISVRTTTGETTKLISSIKERFPSANIWCAGPFPSHCPKDFHMEELFYAYRCTPKTQRILEAVEPFCRNETSRIFNYTTTSTSVPRSPISSTSERQHRLPDDGSDPVFFSHAYHGPGEIVDCPTCAQYLVDYLKNTLSVGKNGSSGKSLEERDVLIVVTGTGLYNHMRGLVHTEFFRKLTTANFRVNVYSITDTFSLLEAGISMLHVRAVAGMEKKVVICVPCKQHQAINMSYADAVRSQPLQNPMPAVHHGETPITRGQGQMLTAQREDQAPAVQNQGQPKSGQMPVVHQDRETNLQGRSPTLVVRSRGQSPGTRSQGQPETGSLPVAEGNPIISNSQRHIREKLEMCCHVTADQRQKLARLGALNLHWLWYAASRSLSHVVIYHF